VLPREAAGSCSQGKSVVQNLPPLLRRLRETFELADDWIKDAAVIPITVPGFGLHHELVAVRFGGGRGIEGLQPSS
jgi:hypothetical protein